MIKCSSSTLLCETGKLQAEYSFINRVPKFLNGLTSLMHLMYVLMLDKNILFFNSCFLLPINCLFLLLFDVIVLVWFLMIFVCIKEIKNYIFDERKSCKCKILKIHLYGQKSSIITVKVCKKKFVFIL